MSDFAMGDIGNRLNIDKTTSKKAEHSTSTKAGQSLEMDDFLMLMVATLQNQSIDDTADTSDMLNQMVQMSMITAMNNISNLVTESTSLTYAASLVGKEVTVGIYEGGELKEIYGEVTGTGTLNGRQVIFMGDDIYYLTDVMAVGKLPASDEEKAAAGGNNAAGGAGNVTPNPGEGDDDDDNIIGDDDDDDNAIGDGGDDDVNDGNVDNDDAYDGSDGVDA